MYKIYALVKNCQNWLIDFLNSKQLATWNKLDNLQHTYQTRMIKKIEFTIC